MIDSHAHVSTPRFAEDRADVLARAWAAGLEAIVDVGCDLASSEVAAAFAATDPRLFAAVGVHPHEARTWSPEVRAGLVALAARPRVVAIGEVGLDFHYDHSPRDDQRRAFREQLALADELGLPVVLHVREAYDEALDLLAARAPARRGVAHCFTGTRAQALGFVALGFCVSFSGVVTFKNAAEIQEAARAVPEDHLLVETDCPYMAPMPHRGKRCEPAFVADTLRGLAALRGTPLPDLARATAANARRALGF